VPPTSEPTRRHESDDRPEPAHRIESTDRHEPDDRPEPAHRIESTDRHEPADRPRVAIVVDGRSYRVPADATILDAVLAVGRDLPHLCRHPDLGTPRTCDTCLVEADGTLVRACATPVHGGLRVDCDTDRAQAARTEAMHRILEHHELYCTVCDNSNGDCDLHQTFAAMGIDHQRYPHRPSGHPVDDSHPFYRYDPDQCILCGRCVEACQDLQVNETLTIDWSLPRPRVVWDGGVPAGRSSCVGCGHCVTVCPCNALMEKTMVGQAGLLTGLAPEALRPMIDLTKAVEPGLGLRSILAVSDAEAAVRPGLVKRTKTVCTYCGVGCSFTMWTRGRRILRVQPSPEAPANQVSTCVKGKFGWGFVNHPDRLRRPLVRHDGRFVEVDWPTALDAVASGIRRIRDAHGPDALGFIASSKCSNEEAYLVQKLARAVVGTNNVDNCSRYCQSPATMGLSRTVGIGGDAGSIADIARADLVLIVGSNTAESHPVIATRVKRAQKLHGQTIIVADLRRHEMAERADVFLRPRPSTDMVWILAVTRAMFDLGLADERFLAERVDGVDELRASLEPYTLAFAEEVTGIPADELRAVAERIGRARAVCCLWAMGVTQHRSGSDISTALSNLLLVTGNYGRPGTGAFPLRGHNNVQGASDFGAMPDKLPGYQAVDDDEARARYEAAWGVSLPTTPGLDNHQMVEAIHDGHLRGLYLIGEEMGLVDANASDVQRAFTELELLVVQDIFFTSTARFADVVLPAAPSVEKDGTFTNTERRIQRFHQVLAPLGDSRPDWRIVQDVARALGADWDHEHPATIMAEAAATTPLFAGVSYERLTGWRSLQWPVAADGTDTPLLYTDGFPFPGGRARLHPVAWEPPSEEADDHFDVHVNNGRLLEHFHEGNLTARTAGIAEATPSVFVEVSPELAEARGIRDGALLSVRSRRGAVRVRAVVTDRVRGHEVYLPMNATGDDQAVNVLTSSHTDRATHTPAYKELAAAVEVLEAEGPPPLPRRNFRHGHRTPQIGVRVEEKWRRADYRMPPAPRPAPDPTPRSPGSDQTPGSAATDPAGRS
jgi:formate dehydrogenase major subunit